MLAEFLRGLGYFLAGFGLIAKPRLRAFVVGPLLINIALFFSGGYLLVIYASEWIDYLISFLPSWLEWLEFLLWPLIAASIMLTVFFAFTPIALLIASPFNGYLSEFTERYLNNTLPDSSEFTLQGLIKEVWLTMRNELSKLLYFLLRAIPLLLLYFIPVVNAGAPFIWFFFSAWMLALTYIDYPFSNRSIWFAAQRPIIRQKRAVAIGFGCAVGFCTMIPVLNFFVIPAAVCGATKLWVEQFSSSAPAISR